MKTFRAYCRDCHNNTRHSLKAEYEHAFESEDYPDMIEDHAKASWQIWQCQGCDTVIFTEIWTISSRHTQKERKIFKSYPENEKITTMTEKDFVNIPIKLKGLYSEIINAYNAKCFLLTAVGLRALLEGVCNDKGIEKGPDAQGKIVRSLEGKINGMKLFIPEHIINNLHAFRFLGNDAVHQLSIPNDTNLRTAIIIIEDILNIVYSLDYTSSAFLRRVTQKPLKTDENDQLF